MVRAKRFFKKSKTLKPVRSHKKNNFIKKILEKYSFIYLEVQTEY